jgi:hypothetical protein
MGDTDKAGVVFDADEVVTKTVNSNGQVYLGRDLDGEDVRIAFKVVDDDGDDTEASDE